jgi:hypothetical protein
MTNPSLGAATVLLMAVLRTPGWLVRNGLNHSRAWMLEGIAAGLLPEHRRAATTHAAAR